MGLLVYNLADVITSCHTQFAGGCPNTSVRTYRGNVLLVYIREETNSALLLFDTAHEEVGCKRTSACFIDVRMVP